MDRPRGRAALGCAPLLQTQLLDRGLTARPVGPVSAAIGHDGTATVAWSGMSVANRELTYPVRVATALPGRRFGAATQLAPNGAARAS